MTTTDQNDTLTSALSSLRRAQRARAAANRRRDLVAEAAFDGDPAATTELVAAATLAAVRANRAVQHVRGIVNSILEARTAADRRAA